MPRVTAHDFAGDTIPPRLGFGIDCKRVAESLRELATEIENGSRAVESVRVQTLASASEFTQTLLRIKLFEPKS